MALSVDAAASMIAHLNDVAVVHLFDALAFRLIQIGRILNFFFFAFFFVRRMSINVVLYTYLDYMRPINAMQLKYFMSVRDFFSFNQTNIHSN